MDVADGEDGHRNRTRTQVLETNENKMRILSEQHDKLKVQRVIKLRKLQKIKMIIRNQKRILPNVKPIEVEWDIDDDQQDLDDNGQIKIF